MMKVIGLTGKTGSGKSIISSLLKDMGVYVIDTDIIARKVVEKDMPALKELCEAFGDVILKSDKALDRKVLAKLAFSSKENTKTLSGITHPYITKEVGREISFAKENGYDFCVIDAAVLLESECKDFCDIVAVVCAKESVRLKRIMARDDIDEQSALLRMRAQKSDEYYLKNADIIIMNDGSVDLEDSAKKLLEFARKNG